MFPHPSPCCRRLPGWRLPQRALQGRPRAQSKAKKCCHCCNLCCSQWSDCRAFLRVQQLLPCASSPEMLPAKLVVQILLQGYLQFPFQLSILQSGTIIPSRIMWGTSNSLPVPITSSENEKIFLTTWVFFKWSSFFPGTWRALLQRIGPNTTIWGWCTSGKSRLAQNTNCRDANIPLPTIDTERGLFVSLLLLTTSYFVRSHKGNACHRLGRTMVLYKWNVALILSRSNTEDQYRLLPSSFTVLLSGNCLKISICSPPWAHISRGDSTPEYTELRARTYTSASTVGALGVAWPHWFLSLKDETENELIFFPWLKLCNKVSGRRNKKQPDECTAVSYVCSGSITV